MPGLLYLAFTAVEGAMMAFIFLLFSPATITMAFGGALLIFGVMSIYGLTTHRNLAGLGQLCLMGLIGLVAAGLFNIFVLQSEGLRLFMSVITIPVFMGLTAWETREIKREAQKGSQRRRRRSRQQVGAGGSRRDVPEHPEHVPGVVEPAEPGLRLVRRGLGVPHRPIGSDPLGNPDPAQA